MSLSALARASRIDSEVSRIARQASQLNSQLATIVGETNAFAALALCAWNWTLDIKSHKLFIKSCVKQDRKEEIKSIKDLLFAGHK